MSDNHRNHSNHKQLSGVRVLIFDLDGTLIDSKLDLALSVNATLEHMNCSPLPHETIFSFVGDGATTLIERAIARSCSKADVAQATKYFLAYYHAHMLDHTVVYPGVREGLELLEGRSMAVLTNKPVAFSREILEGLGLARHFQFVYGGNSFEKKKPDPEGVNTLLRDFAASPSEAMIVGDSAVDVRTGRNAGVWVCCVSYGLGTDSLRADPPDLMLDSLIELPARLEGPLVR